MVKDQIIRILLVDDHPMMREGLRCTLERERDIKVVAEASDGHEAIAMFRELQPEVALIDLQMPRVDGIEAISEIRSDYPDARLIVLTTYSGDGRVARAMAAGAISYLLKTASSEEIVETVRRALDGRKVVTHWLLHDLHAHHGYESPTARELAVLRRVAQGLTNRAIGLELRISEDTVKTRMKSVSAKLEAKDRAHAVTIAMRRGFLDEP
ncbi:MAG TPA: response regulator transcription factor [Dyella sp.]|uniref:response regulator transcription factor n=1 Tax=Dyella sp. TaxID=1869338 RepID=UPI002D1BCAAF|nr:response regulator transcription factor [Dyella sp.]HTV87172.1 response regulator transcription factor [Dyella sp.]